MKLFSERVPVVSNQLDLFLLRRTDKLIVQIEGFLSLDVHFGGPLDLPWYGGRFLTLETNRDKTCQELVHRTRKNLEIESSNWLETGERPQS